MAKKKLAGNNLTEPTTLKKTKEDFERELEEQIKQGQTLFSAAITDDSSFISIKKDFRQWSEYNLELLKQSFNHPYNEFWRSYGNSDNMVGLETFTAGGKPDPNQGIRILKSQISSKLDNLVSLKKRIGLLSSTGSEKDSSKVLYEIDKTTFFYSSRS